jgi:hypothetical protein
MTLAIIFKGTEGIVVAADNRVTLTFQVPGTQLVTPAHFDNELSLNQSVVQGIYNNARRPNNSYHVKKTMNWLESVN